MLVPVDTWHSLPQSLMPNQVIKKTYTTGLCLAIQADTAEAGRRTSNACDQGSDTACRWITNRFIISGSVRLPIFDAGDRVRSRTP